MDERTIVSAAWLRDHLDDPHLVILDSRFSLDDEEWGERTYLEGHIPGAMYANTATHLAGEIIPGVTGRRPFPEPSVFAEQLGAWGISDSTQVVTYDADGGRMSAARVWLMLRWMGHDRVAVLDGGWQAWLSQGGEVTTDVPAPATAQFAMRMRPELLADVDEVDEHRQRAATCVFDSRGAEGYHGGGVYHDPVRGHIAGAGLADRANTTNTDLTFRSPDDLRAYYVDLLSGVDPQEVIYYCGSGITAAQNVLAMSIAGLEGSRMYVGSWSEWITDPSRPVEL
ncbi:MAG: sulfurtransferase [Candidatus Nanopelagicales bacterium]|jgi:thiosulfate/3-mercaptopyruvate sulfurtransferase